MIWEIVEPEDRPAEMHIIPSDDLIEHEESTDCVCLPTSETVFCNDGSFRYMYTHHSLDGRELLEPDHA